MDEKNKFYCNDRSISSTPNIVKLGVIFIAIYYTWAYMPICQGYFGFFINEIYVLFFVAMLLLGLFCVVVANGWKIFFNKLMFLGCCYILFHFIFFISGMVESSGHFYRSFIFWSTVFVVTILKPYKEALLKLVTYLIVLFFITLVTSGVGTLSQSNIARLLTSTTRNTIENNIEIYRANIGDIQFFQMLILLVPVLFVFVLYSTERYIKYISFLGIIIIGVVLISASFTIAIIMYIVSIVLSLCLLKNKYIGIFVLIFGMFVMFIVPWGDILLFLANQVENRYISIRLEEMSVFFLQGQLMGDLESRMDLYMRSWNTFINNPFGIGPIYKNIVVNKNMGIGYHSQLIDDLARFGVFTIPFYLFFSYQYYINLKKEWMKLGYQSVALVVTIIYFFMLVLNLGTTSIYESVMGILIIPMIPELILTKSKRKNK